MTKDASDQQGRLQTALAVVLEEPERIQLREVDAGCGHRPGTWSCRCFGVASALAPSACCIRDECQTSLEWAIRLCPATNRSVVIQVAGPESGRNVGETVFVPGARGFTDVRGLFGGAAATLVTPGSKVAVVPEQMGETAILFALAATAYHAIAARGATPPELIIGHGVLGRLLARACIALGHPAPIVWEKNAARAGDAIGYLVTEPEQDVRRDYRAIYDVSGDSRILDQLTSRLGAGGEIVLAGFYTDPLSFQFAPAFMREARIRIAAEWRPDDLIAVQQLVASGTLSLHGLITHQRAVGEAAEAYRIAFEDPACLKMVLDWRGAVLS